MPELVKDPRTTLLFPLKLREDVEVHNAAEMGVLVMAETSAQVATSKGPIPNSMARKSHEIAKPTDHPTAMPQITGKTVKAIAILRSLSAIIVNWNGPRDRAG